MIPTSVTTEATPRVKLAIRTDPALRDELAAVAKERAISFNQLCEHLLRKGLSTLSSVEESLS